MVVVGISMGTFTYWHELGRQRERTYYLGIRAEPSLNNVQSFAVVLYYEHPAGGFVEIAKIDNSSHAEGDIHVDRYYREPSASRKDFDVDVSTLPEAERYLRENWRRFAVLHDRIHG